MTWNCRVMVRTDKQTGEKIYAIHEVYYDQDGNPESCTENPVSPMGETVDELRGDLSHYQEALAKPVLRYEDLKPEESDGKREEGG